jgi:hypothetical protein
VILGDARENEIVQSVGNGSYYRMVQMEGSGAAGKARIRPLELMPNGLLLEKPTDTTVHPGIVVQTIGRWRTGEEFFVVDGRAKSRKAYERELEKKEVELVALEAELELLPVGGKGKQSRGSHANKIRSCRARIEAIGRGLETRDQETQDAPTPAAVALAFSFKSLVQLPSGAPAMYMGSNLVGQATMAAVLLKGSGPQSVPIDSLRPLGDRHLATI